MKRDTLSMDRVAAYLRITCQRVAQMYEEGKLPEPDRVDLRDGSPSWELTTIARWAEAQGWATRGWRKRH